MRFYNHLQMTDLIKQNPEQVQTCTTVCSLVDTFMKQKGQGYSLKELFSKGNRVIVGTQQIFRKWLQDLKQEVPTSVKFNTEHIVQLDDSTFERLVFISSKTARRMCIGIGTGLAAKDNEAPTYGDIWAGDTYVRARIIRSKHVAENTISISNAIAHSLPVDEGLEIRSIYTYDEISQTQTIGKWGEG